MSGTHVYYNKVLLRDCETIDYSCVLEYDESMTHERFMRTRITVESTLVSLYLGTTSTPLAVADQHRSTIRIFSIENGDETTPARIEEIMQLLNEPRKDFWYAVNGVIEPSGTAAVPSITTPPKEDRTGYLNYRLVLIGTGTMPTPGVSPGDPVTNEFVKFFSNNLSVKRVDVLDANNGPKPSDVSFRKQAGGNVLRVRATFEICRVLSKPIPDADNPDPGYDAQKVRGAIANSWSVVDGLDDDGEVTHNVRGKIVVKDQRFKVNAMRMFAFPLAFPYARLTSRQYTVDATGLVLEYQYQFKHAGAAPPAGVRKYEATYVEAASAGAAGIYRGTMGVKVMGWHDRTDDASPLLERERKQKLILIRGAQTIMQSRITGINKLWDAIPGQNAKSTVVLDSKIIERIGYPGIEMQVTVSYGDANPTEFQNRVRNMGKPISIENYDPRWWPIDNEWGRLPGGNGHADNDGDQDNPNFAMAAYPYAESGDPTQSDYFTGYFQPPGSNRHTLPRITGLTKTDTDTSKEWARPAGYVPETATTVSVTTIAVSNNPAAGPAMSAIPSKTLTGSVVYGPLEPVEDATFTGVASVQESGFHYIAWSSEVMSDTNQGKIMLPLSVPRDIPVAKRASLLGISVGSAGGSSGKECSVAVSLCAPKSQRVYSVSTTRSQKWGQIPEPNAQIVRTTGSGSTQKIRNVETLVNKEVLNETPELQPDQITRLFVTHARYFYGLSNPWRGTEAEGGYSAADTTASLFETLPVGESPIDKATAANNAIVVKGGVGTLSPLFDDTQYG